ncbi:MAG: carbohydrate-binding family 9-like protein [Myxococcales bacterium]
MTRVAISVMGLCLALTVGAAGCSKKGALSPEQQTQVQKYVSKTPTKPQHPLDIKFDDKVTLIGYDVSSEELTPGQPVTVTWHYKVEHAAPSGYKQFTHLADARNRSRINLDHNGPLRSFYEPSLWEPGTYVRDEQVISVPNNWNSPKAVVYLGFWKDDMRLSVKGPQDKENRARALELPVKGAESPLPELHAVEVPASAPVKLDGKLDESIWSEAKPTALFVNTMTGDAADFPVTAKAAWDAQNLYVAFDVADDYLKSTFTKDDDHLWEQDTVELMIDPDGDEKNYFELQVSPAGKVFDTRYDSRRVPQPFGHMDFNSGLKNGVAVRGTLNDDEADQGYTVEAAIPWTAFTLGDPKHEPPKAGETWRMNLYVMDAREKGMRAAGWSAPLVGDFHVPSRFGKLVFEGKTAEAPVAESETAPATDVAKKMMPSMKKKAPEAAAKSE